MSPKTNKMSAPPAHAGERCGVAPTHSKELDAAISTILQTYGEGSILRLGNAKSGVKIEVIPTGALGVDFALGVGGLPRGRVIEIFGSESSGKTTLLLQIIASVQESGGQAAFIDVDHALDPVYAKKLGVNLNTLLVAQPDNGEEALAICETLARSNAMDVIMFDSVAALVPGTKSEGETGMATSDAQARLMSQALPKLTAILNKSKTACVFANQSPEKGGMMLGTPEPAQAGPALKFYASVRLEISRRDTIKDAAGNAIGNQVLVKVVKNKVAPPLAETEFDLFYNRGINKESSILDAAIAIGIVDKKGTWLQFEGELIGQGRDAAQKALAGKPELTKKIVEAILLKRNGAVATT